LEKLQLAWKWKVERLSDWTGSGDVSVEEINRGFVLFLLSTFFNEQRKSFELVCPAATDDGRERRAFDSEIENAKMELKQVWDNRIITIIMRIKRSEILRAMRKYTSISDAQNLSSELDELKKKYPQEFHDWFELFGPEKYVELKRRAGIVDVGDSDKERMDKTLISALNAWEEKYLRSIGESKNIEELENVKMDMENKLKEEIVTKYDADVANTVGLVDARGGDEVYHEFFDSKIKAAYDEKKSQLTAASSLAAASAVVTPHNFK